MKRDIEIRQHDSNDCAAACLASVCAYYGLKLPLIVLREASGTSRDGTTLQGVVDAAHKVGLNAEALKAKRKDIADLKDIGGPVIMHLEKKDGWLHFVVFYGIAGGRASVMDPQDGKMHKMPIPALEEEWSGYIVALGPSVRFEKGDRKTDLFSRFGKLLASNRKELFGALAGSLAYIAVTLGLSLFLRKIIDGALPEKDTMVLCLVAAAMLALAGCSACIGYMRSLLTVRASLKMDFALISGYVRKLFSLPVRFFDSRSSGELNSRISDVYRIREFLTERLLLMAVSVMTVSLSLLVTAFFYWKLSLVLCAFIPLYIVLYRVSDKVNRKVNRRIIEEAARFEEMTVESISTVRTAKYFNYGKCMSDRLMLQYVSAANAMYRGGVCGSAFASAADTLGRLLSLSVLMAGAFFVLRSELTIGELVSFYTIAGFFSSPVMLLVNSNQQITEAMIAAERVFDIMDLDEDRAEREIRFMPQPGADIVIRDLSYSFPGKMKLIEGLNATVRGGCVNLVCGKNGSGKSTLASILMGGYRPLSGSITVEGVDIMSLQPEKWREYISIVPQRLDLFNGTVLDNIVLGDKDYDMERVLHACALSGLAGTVASMPEGLLTRTGESSCRLSGGEKKRLAIARALYRRPSALIFDEASSALDAEGKDHFRRLVRRLSDEGMTIILISHERDMVSLADNVIELKNTDAHPEA